MTTIAALFQDRGRALQARDTLLANGFEDDAVTLVSSPTGAGEAAWEAARELEPIGGGLIDYGAATGGQADPEFPDAERRLAEERVAQHHLLVRVAADDRPAAERAEAMLRAAGADQVLPGTIRD